MGLTKKNMTLAEQLAEDIEGLPNEEIWDYFNETSRWIDDELVDREIGRVNYAAAQAASEIMRKRGMISEFEYQIQMNELPRP